MDATLNALAYKLSAKMPEQGSPHQEIYLQEVHRMRYRLGSVLVSVGQKLQETRQQAQAACNTETHGCIEAVG